MTSDGFDIVSRWPAPVRPGAKPSILCPCFEGLDARLAPWVSVLPIHDANGLLLDALAGEAFRAAPSRPDYAGVCLIDPFRRFDAIVAAVAGSGIPGIVNLPSVAAFAGAVLDGLEDFASGLTLEAGRLRAAAAAGLRIAGVAADAGHEAELRRLGCDFVLRLSPDGLVLAADAP